MRRSIIGIIVALCSFTAHAATIDQPLADAAQEQSARAIFRELKCVVCEGQSLAESDATLAKQMRAQIRGMVSNGDERDSILTYYRARYGDRILLNPPVKNTTYALWLMPVFILLIGGLLLHRALAKGTA